MAEFRSSSRSRDLGDGSNFDSVVGALLTWRIHRDAGYRAIVAPSRVTAGATFVARVPWFPVTVRCQVTEVFEEADRAGFRYATLRGHPLEGEELFLVEVVDGRTVFSVSERSRPARWLMHLPGARRVQAKINARYLTVAARIAATAPSP